MAAPLARALRLAGIPAVLKPRAARAALLLATALVPVAVLAIAAALLPPERAGALGDLRAWCVGVAPSPWAGAAAVALPVGALIAALLPARRLLVELARSRPHVLLGHGIVAVALTGAAAAAITLSGAVPPHLAPPPLGSVPRLDRTLTDQAGSRGRVVAGDADRVLVFAFYSSCSTECPMTFGHVKDALDGLGGSGEGERVAVVGVTLDPERDDVARLAELAAAHGFRAPRQRLLTGEPADVEATLDALGFERRLDPGTGLVDHAGGVILLDGHGRVLGRYGSDSRSSRLLAAALSD